MNERARKRVAPVRLNVLLPLVLGTLAGACFLVSAVVLGSITQARGPIEEHLPRIGTLMLVSFGGMLLLFAAAWAVLHLWVVRPIQILTGEAETLALTQQNRELLMPSRHALERLPRAVERLAQKLAAARTGTGEAIADATQRAEEQKTWLEAILLDLTEGIIVCNLEHRILLYNQAAARILNMRDALGLGRSLFGLLTREPILQTLELLQQAGQAAGKTGPDAAQRASEQQSHRFVCATVDVGTLLETRLSLVQQRSGAASGYVLSFADIGPQIENLALRDAILRETMVEWRRPLANLRAAAETLFANPTLKDADRAAFEQIIANEVENLNNRFLEASRRYERLTAGPWPMSDIHSLDLFRVLQKHLYESDGIELTLVGMPLWLQADSHSLILALEHLIRAVANYTGKSAFDIEALGGENYGYVEVAWEGAPIPSATIESWLDEPLKGTIANRKARQILERHGSDLWSKPRGDGGACLRLPLRLSSRPQIISAGPPVAPRPEYYDFDLFKIADTALADTPLKTLRYVVFDTETTGLRPSEGDELIAIAAVRIVNGRILTGETFERLMNPGRSIPAASVRIHGITEDMARDKPPARIVLSQFKNFVGDGVLVAWNAAFDMRFLELKQDDAGVRFDNPVLDALLLSIYVSDDPINHSLMATAERLGVVVTGRHTALGDAMATAAIWVKLLDLLEARGIRTLGQAFKISSRLVAERRQLAQF
jgi:DNA polymerase III subunit epsilon